VYYEQRYVRLAESVPAEKYVGRPVEGVRSIGEVYMHIVTANYGVARSLRTPPPAGFDFNSITAMSTDKAKTVEALKDSFAHFRPAIQALNDADANKPQKMFGRQTHPAGLLHPYHRTLRRTPGPVHRLCADERHSAALDRRTTAATKTSRETKTIVAWREIPGSASARDEYYCSIGKQQLPRLENQN
jgi:hypothetical protein